MGKRQKVRDRILWNRRPTGIMDRGDIDEIVIRDASTVHIEQMDDRCWWIGIYKDGELTYWMGNFTCDSRGRMRFTEQENAGIEWDRDDTHELPASGRRPNDGEAQHGQAGRYGCPHP